MMILDGQTVQPVRPVQMPYRLRQFIGGLRAELSATEQDAVAAQLPPAAHTLFQQMPVDAQRHSFNVLAATQAAGFADADLAVAALLHDVGKVAAAQAGYPLNLWWRGPLVVLEAVTPRLLRRLAMPTPTGGWRYVLHVHLEHPAIGAAWAEAAGCSPLACWLIAHHQDRPAPPAPTDALTLLHVLQQADDSH